MLRNVIAAALAAGTLLAAPAAFAQAGIKVGELTCNIGRDVGLILGSRAALVCSYEGVGGAVESYHGTITKLGVDVGVTDEGVIVWAVIAPGANISNDALAGTYYGVSADVAAGVGVGANVLVGGFDRTITLQPLSVQGEVGAAVSAGVSEMRLERP